MYETRNARPPVRSISMLQIEVATATAIVISREDPRKVLIARSRKHPRPILPGGKIEQADLGPDNDRAQAAFRCIVRELSEEIGVITTSPEPLFVIDQGGADIREVPTKILRNCIGLSDKLSLNDGELVKARYGAPDFIFKVTVAPRDITSTEELHQVKFVDIDDPVLQHLAVGHSQVVQRYKQVM